MKKKILLSLALVFAVGFLAQVTLANDNKSAGEDSNNQKKIYFQNNSGDKNNSENINKDSRDSNSEKNSEDVGEDGATPNENNLNSLISKLPDSQNTVQVKEADSSAINTYADLVNLLNKYQTAVDSISNSSGVSTSNLSPAEQALLQALAKKDSFVLSRSKARLDEVSSHIKDLIVLLTPLGNQTITENYGLKSLLLSTVNEIAGNINESSSLHDQGDKVLEAETD